MSGKFIKLPTKQSVRLFIGKHRGIYYFVFKVLLPFMLTLVQLDYVCAITSGILVNKYNAHITNAMLSIICCVAFFTFLCLLPRLSSVLEFIIHGLFFLALFKYHNMIPQASTIAVIASIVLLSVKTWFFIEFIVEDEIDKIKNGDDYYSYYSSNNGNKT